MKSSGKRTWRDVKQALLANCCCNLDMSAAVVPPQHIKMILRKIIYRGSDVQSTRFRSHLNRAFEFGIFYDNAPEHLSSSILFNIPRNPVALVPKNIGTERVGERALSFDELLFICNYNGSNLPLTLKTPCT